MAFIISNGSRGSFSSVAGRAGRSLFFAVFLGMGLFFLWLFGRAMFDAARTLLWKETPATILGSEVEPDGDDYRLVVRYEYEWEGRAYTSGVLSKITQNYNHRDEAYAEAAKLAPGAKTTCRVDPASPSHAVLRTGNLWVAVFAIIPLAFVGVGAGGIWLAWARPRNLAASESRPRAAAARRVIGPGMFGGIFVVVGLVSTWFLTVPMWSWAIASTKWAKTPCTIVSSRVESHSGDKGTTYSVDIVYRYTFGGREYRGDRYSAVTGSSSGYDGKEEIVARYPPGSQSVCYVNPARPYEALLKPGFSWGLLFGLLPLVFVGVGAIIMFFGGGRRAGIASSPEPRPRESLAVEGPVELRSASSPWKRVAMMVLVALFWNGIVSIFVLQAVSGFRHGRPEWTLVIFLAPFVLIGIALLGAVVHALLALANPRVRLTVDSPVIAAGGLLKASWEMTGAVRRIGRFWIYLEGREEATYTRGTNTTTDKSVFARLPVVEISSSWMEMLRGEGTLQMPADVPPTFRGNRNRIVWSIKVRGEVARWPDVAEEYEILVVPSQRTA